MTREATWSNKDGLVVGFGTRVDSDHVPGVHAGRGVTRSITCEYNLADLVDTFAAANRSPNEIVIPRGSLITSAYLVVVTPAASSGGGTFELGLWGTNDVVDDADGIVATVAVSEINSEGEVHICDGALVAAMGNTAAATVITVGATSNSDVVLAPSYATAVFQSGVVRLVMEYIAPSPSAVAN